MAIERLVGVNVTDEAGYQAYREGMLPILKQHGGEFTTDVRVSEVLLAPGNAKFNRLFTLRFPDEEAMTAFFSNPAYQAVRNQFFNPSVSEATPLFKYEVLP
ncbi:MAG: DUF1330 domain-containing protein [Myxococcota bacterium]